MPQRKTQTQVLNEIKIRNENFDFIVPYDLNFQYKTTSQKIDWVCNAGHVFSASFKNILKGHGCKQCQMIWVGYKNTKPLSDLLLRLGEYNKTTSRPLLIKDESEYKGMTKPMTWICEEGHEWQAAPKTVLKGHYCRKCADKTNADNQRKTLEEINKKIVIHNKEHVNRQVELVNIDNYISIRNTTCLFKCTQGHTWNAKLSNIISKHAGCPICSKAGYSLKAISWLDSIASQENINIQHALNGGEYTIPKSHYRADGYCVSTNTIYEFNGDIFHGNPELFNQDDVSSLTNKTYGELYSATMKKEKWIVSQGYNLITIWEHFYDEQNKIQKALKQLKEFFNRYDVKTSLMSPYDLFLDDFNIAINYRSLILHTHNVLADRYYHSKFYDIPENKNVRLLTIFSHEWLYNKNKVKDTLRYLVGHATKGAAGRKCTINEISWATAKEFLNDYHLLNSGSGTTYSLGAFDNDRLVAVMTFGKPCRELGITDYYEMTRFVTDKTTHPGLASKMFKYAVKKYNFSKVVAFVDRRWFTGEFKTISGFKTISITKPAMWYTDGKKLYHRRFISRQRLLSDLKMPDDTTKDAMLLALGYKVIYDCGKLKLVWEQASI